jgi:hypothetical protein
MTNENIMVRAGSLLPDRDHDFDKALQELIVRAHGEGRTFLAYLLVMALMHSREEDEGRSGLPH